LTKEDAEKLGVKFGRGGPPRFTNKNKKELEIQKSATEDGAGQDSNSRQVVEM